MFKINSSTKEILLTRGDKATIGIKIPLEDETFYQFKAGDVLTFGVYKAKGFNSNALIFKEVTVQEETDEVVISLTGADTKIGNLSSKPTTYWYEVELNNEETIIGYDEEGAKILTLYPEGSDAQ